MVLSKGEGEVSWKGVEKGQLWKGLVERWNKKKSCGRVGRMKTWNRRKGCGRFRRIKWHKNKCKIPEVCGVMS